MTWYIGLIAINIVGCVVGARPMDDKWQAAEQFVEEAANFFARNSAHTACTDFTHNPQWRFPSSRLVVIDEKGLIWFLMDKPVHLWTPLADLKTERNVPLTHDMRLQGQKGGWVAFIWDQALVRAYVKNVHKADQLFTIGLLVFSENPRDQIQEQVLAAYSYLRDHGIKRTAEEINNPNGRFLHGSLSVALYDQDGICLADSFDWTHINQRSTNWLDDSGQSVFSQFVAAAQHSPSGNGWVKYTFQGMIEHAFVKYVPHRNPKKFYILASGYYPAVDEKFVVNFAQQASDYIKQYGIHKALADFAEQRTTFYKARLALVIYDEKGIVKAQTRFPSLIGVNAYNLRDQAGYPITQLILKKGLEEGHGSVFQYVANAAEPVYCQKLVVPEGVFVITVQGFTPLHKMTLAAGIAEWLSYRLANQPARIIMNALNQGDVVGNIGFRASGARRVYTDFVIEIYDGQGFCLSAGSNYYLIWQAIDRGMKLSVEKMKRAGASSGSFHDVHQGIGRDYYLKECVKSAREKYYIFVGYHTLRKGAEE